VLRGEPRIDGRDPQMVRALSVGTGLLPRVHGSALYHPGVKPRRWSPVLWGPIVMLRLWMSGLLSAPTAFMLHYNFRRTAWVKPHGRLTEDAREIGHGLLASVVYAAVMPSPEQFPYTVRIVSENPPIQGSSSRPPHAAPHWRLNGCG
jgi:polyribonucleotide nucleotidyltransferase